MIDHWDGKMNVYFYNDVLAIGHTPLFTKLIKMGFEVIIYSNKDNCLSLRGTYQKNQISKIKRFFFDTYPLVERIVPMKSGINVFFKTKIYINNVIYI